MVLNGRIVGPARTRPVAPFVAGIAVLTAGGTTAACETFFPLGGYSCDGFCGCLRSTPTFCDDFDKGALGASWSAEAGRQDPGTTMGLDQGVSVSPPNSLRVTAVVPDGGASAYLAREFEQRFTEAQLDFDLLAANGFLDDQVVDFQFASGYSIALVFTSDSVLSFEEPSNTTHLFTDLAPPRPGQWTHVTLRLHLTDPDSDAGGFFRLSLGDPDAGGVSAPNLSIPSDGSGNLTLQLGGAYIQNSPNGWTGNFDNVVLRLN